MSVTWIDLSGSTLPTRSEAIDFTVSGGSTTPVPFISVSFGDGRAEELAYRDGAFRYPYLQSTRAGGTFSLRRTGGWPSTASVSVEEATPAPTTFWSTLYEKDLRTLASQTVRFSTVNEYVSFVASDGVRWSFHGSGGSTIITNGIGMQLSSNARQLTSVNNAYAGTRTCIVCNELPGFHPARLTAVQVRFAGTLPIAQEFGSTVWMGSENWGYGPGANNCTTKITRPSGDLSVKWTCPHNLEWDDVRIYNRASGVVPAVSPPISGWTAASAIAPNYLTTYGLFHDGQVASELPTIEQMRPAGAYAHNIGTYPGSYVNPLHMGFYVGRVTGVDVSLVATHIKVLQRTP